VLVEGVARGRVRRFVRLAPFFKMEIVQYIDDPVKNPEVEALMRNVTFQFEQYIKLSKRVPPDMMSSMVNLDEPGSLCDTIASHLALRIEEKQELISGERGLQPHS